MVVVALVAAVGVLWWLALGAVVDILNQLFEE